jgi:(p)ppGpp synthase/HD superfamily hydrolase
MITRKEVKDGVKNIIGKSINNNKEEIIIGWERWIDYKMCKKCWIWWKIPNKIVWHINSKWVITIHNRTCSILSNVNKERLLPAHRKWEEDNYIVVSLWLIFLDKLWVLKDLSEIIFSMWINIEEINSKKKEFNKHEIKLKLEIPDYDYLLVDRLVERVRLKFGQNLVSFFVEKIIM